MLTALVLGIGSLPGAGHAVRLLYRAFAGELPAAVVIGVVLALLVTGGNANLMRLIGVIMLMGWSQKNAILLLDCHAGKRPRRRSEEGLMHRAACDCGRS